MSTGQRAQRYALRSVLHSITIQPRVQRCGMRAIDASGVSVCVRAGAAYFRGVSTCAAVHVCPVCGPKIRQARADDIARLWAAHEAAGGGGYLLTLTVSHQRADRLRTVLDWLDAGRRSAFSGRAWVGDRNAHGVVGLVTAFEVTHSARSGWHPHVHVLVLTERPTDKRRGAALRRSIFARYERAVMSAGGRRLLEGIAVDVRPVVKGSGGSGIGTYLAGLDVEGPAIGLELARVDLKSGRSGSRTTGEVLDAIRADGELADVMIFREFERATIGRNVVRWSQGLRARYALAPALTDEEIALSELPVDDVHDLAETLVVWRFTPGQWHSARHHSIALLEAAEAGGSFGVRDVLSRLGLRLGSTALARAG